MPRTVRVKSRRKQAGEDHTRRIRDVTGWSSETLRHRAVKRAHRRHQTRDEGSFRLADDDACVSYFVEHLVRINKAVKFYENATLAPRYLPIFIPLILAPAKHRGGYDNVQSIERGYCNKRIAIGIVIIVTIIPADLSSCLCSFLCFLALHGPAGLTANK